MSKENLQSFSFRGKEFAADMSPETVELPVLWRGIMSPVNGEPFDVKVLGEQEGGERLIVLTDDGQLWAPPRDIVHKLSG